MHTNNIDPRPDYGATNCIYNIDGTDVSVCQQVCQYVSCSANSIEARTHCSYLCGPCDPSLNHARTPYAPTLPRSFRARNKSKFGFITKFNADRTARFVYQPCRVSSCTLPCFPSRPAIPRSSQILCSFVLKPQEGYYAGVGDRTSYSCAVING